MAEPVASSFLSRKLGGVPMPVVVVGGAALALVGYRWWKGRQSASSATTSAPADTSGQASPYSWWPGGGGSIDQGSSSIGDSSGSIAASTQPSTPPTIPATIPVTSPSYPGDPHAPATGFPALQPGAATGGPPNAPVGGSNYIGVNPATGGEIIASKGETWVPVGDLGGGYWTGTPTVNNGVPTPAPPLTGALAPTFKPATAPPPVVAAAPAQSVAAHTVAPVAPTRSVWGAPVTVHPI